MQKWISDSIKVNNKSRHAPREKYIPTKAEVSHDFHGNLMSTLSSVAGVFASYVVAFMIIGNIWYAQLHLFKVSIYE